MSPGLAIGCRLGAAPQGLTLAEIGRAVGRNGLDAGVVTAIALLDGNSTPSCSTRVEFVDDAGRAHEIALGMVERAGGGHFFPHPVTGQPVDDPAERIRVRLRLVEGTEMPSTFSGAFDSLSQ